MLIATKYRILYADTDQMGMVYHANYLRWFEQARNELIRQRGLTYPEYEEMGYYLPVVEANIRFYKPAKYDDIIRTEAQVAFIKKASLQFEYQIFRDAGNELLVKGFTRHANLNHQQKVAVFPSNFKERLSV